VSFCVGAGGSDYLDVLGDVRERETLSAVLETARGFVPDCLGFRFYHGPETSGTGQRLQTVADKLGLACFEEGEQPAPALDLTGTPGVVPAAAQKRSLLAAERSFLRDGSLRVLHLRDGNLILAQLDEFFEQHRTRWQG